MTTALNPSWAAGITGGKGASTGPAYIAGVSSDGTHWVDQHGQPRLFADAEVWMLYCNAGQTNSGNWQLTIDTFYATLAVSGFTAHEVSCYSDYGVAGETYTDGRDWDGTYPFASTFNPTSGLNATFWARRDYALASAQAQGISVVLNMTTMSVSNSMCASWTNTQWTDYGTAAGGWAAGKYPNLFWIMGDDYFGEYDTQFSLFLTALRAAGDTHLISVQNNAESDSRESLAADGPPGTALPWGTANAQFSWGYMYAVCYLCVEAAKAETPALPAMWNDGDGLVNSGAVSGPAGEQYWMRMFLWWALSSGAAGIGVYDENITYWPAGSQAALASGYFYPDQVPAITAAFSSLTGWQNLLPDTASAFVLTGRGTKGSYVTTGSAYDPSAGINNYVTASVTADGTLALIYCAVHFSVTVDQSKMVSGYSATWVDPSTGAKTSATPGSSYSSTGKGNNAQGDPDWLLVLSYP